MKKPYTLLLIVFVLLLSACGPSPEQQAAMTATAMTATAAAWTATPSPTPTLTPTPTVTPTPTLTPTPTPDPSRYYAPDNSFSFVALDGWNPMEAGLKYPALIGPTVNEFALNLVFVTEESGFDAFIYAATVQDQAAAYFPDLVSISEDYLTTVDGEDYFRWEATNTQQGAKFTQIFYFFGLDDWNLTVTYTRPADQGMEYDALVDEAMSTMQYRP